MRFAMLFVALSVAACTPIIIQNHQRMDDPGLIAQAHDSVAYTLKDPASATWRDEYVGKFMASKGAEAQGGYLVCGQYNAKNSYGGYVGFSTYAVLFDDWKRVINVVPKEEALAACRQVGY